MHRTKFRHCFFETFQDAIFTQRPHPILTKVRERSFAVNNLRNRISISEHVFIACFPIWKFRKHSALERHHRSENESNYAPSAAFAFRSSASDLVRLSARNAQTPALVGLKRHCRWGVRSECSSMWMRSNLMRPNKLQLEVTKNSNQSDHLQTSRSHRVIIPSDQCSPLTVLWFWRQIEFADNSNPFILFGLNHQLLTTVYCWLQPCFGSYCWPSFILETLQRYASLWYLLLWFFLTFFHEFDQNHRMAGSFQQVAVTNQPPSFRKLCSS